MMWKLTNYRNLYIKMCKSTFERSLKIFIITYLITSLSSYRSDSSTFRFVSAGSKSSKSASKTTVIAIDGGGGGGKPHPIPVPWPVIHCHHHHHHLKYVPKPVLVHHWVKKIKPAFEIEATQNHESTLPILPMEQQQQQQHQHQQLHPQEEPLEHNHDNAINNGLEYQQSVIRPEKKLPVELLAGDKIVSNLNTAFMQLPLSRQSQALRPAQVRAPQISPLIREQIEKELRRIHTKNINSKVLQSKKLNKLAQSVLLNRLEPEKPVKTPVDIDHDDSQKTMAFTSNKTSEQLGNNIFDDNMMNLIQKPLIYSSSDNKNTFSPAQQSNSRKPNHLFDEPQDQINDESRQHHTDSANQADFFDDLERANLQEQNQASKAFEGLAAEQAGRLMALKLKDAVQPMAPNPRFQAPILSHLNQQPQPFNVDHQAKSSLLMRPDISSRVAGHLSELHTISSMTKLADQMAQTEAKKILDKQERRQRAAANATTQNKGDTKEPSRSLNLFSRFRLPLGQTRDRRRAQPAPPAYIPDLSGAIARLAQLHAVSQAAQVFHRNSLISAPKPVYIPLNDVAKSTSSQQSNFGQPASSRFMSQSANHQSTNDYLSAQASTRVNRIIEPLTIPANLEYNSVVKRHNQSNYSNVKNSPGSSQTPQNNQVHHQERQQVQSVQLRPVRSRNEMHTQSSIDGTNLATTMSPEQEARFYHGQQDHLSKKKQLQSVIDGQVNDRQRQVSGGSGGNLLPDISKANATKYYQSTQSSDVHNLIADPREPLQTNLTNAEMEKLIAGSTGDPHVESKIGQQAHDKHLRNFLNSQPWEQSQRHFQPNPFHTAQTFNRPIKISHNIVQENGPDLQQQQQQQQYSADQLMTLPSYLEFPLSPEQWSAEALKSMNRPSKIAHDNRHGDKQKDESDESSPNYNFEAAEALQGNSNSTQLDELLYDLPAGLVPQLPQASHNKVVYDYQGRFQEPASPFFGQSQPHSMFSNPGGSDLHLNPLLPLNDLRSSFMSPFAAHSGGPLQTQPSYVQPIRLEPSKSFMSDMYDPASMSNMMTASSNFNPMQPSGPYNYMSAAPGLSKGAKKQLKGSITGGFGVGPQTGGFGFGNQVGGFGAVNQVGGLGLNGGLNLNNQVDPIDTANNDMSQLQQLHSSLNQGINQADNITAMARLSQQLRDQMRTLQQRLPSMPNIPNIPQPPQIPNLPMPPPGMMQMAASMALPFAMARATRNANRIRDQRVNSAVNGGGSSAGTGQRLLNNAARYLRTRRRPTQTPTGGSSESHRTRRRLSGVIQTIVDIRRRPPSLTTGTGHRLMSTAGALTGGAKLKPKIDLVRGVKAKRLSRSFTTDRAATQSRSNSSIILPGSMLATLNDGTVHRFPSMTSPMDTLASQLARQRQQSGRRVPYVSSANLHEGNPGKLNMMASDYGAENQELSTGSIGQPSSDAELISVVPLPVVANHINLLLFAAQNVTGNLNKSQENPSSSSSAAQRVAEPIQSTYIESPKSKVQQEHHETGDEDSSNSLKSDQQNEAVVSAVEEQQQLLQQRQPPESQDQTSPGGFLAPKGEQVQAEPEDQVDPANQTPPPGIGGDILKKKEPQQQQEQEQQVRGESGASYEPEASVFAPIISPMISAQGFRPLEKSERTTTRTPMMISKTTPARLVQQSSTSTAFPSGSSTFIDTNIQQQPMYSKYDVKAGKFKRSTDPPAKKTLPSFRGFKSGNTATIRTDSVGGSRAYNITGTTEPATTTTTSTTTTTTTTTTRMPLSEVIQPAASNSNSDYVRAVKLVRGVGYPWPPPTKSSKLLDPSELRSR